MEHQKAQFETLKPHFERILNESEQKLSDYFKHLKKHREQGYWKNQKFVVQMGVNTVGAFTKNQKTFIKCEESNNPVRWTQEDVELIKEQHEFKNMLEERFEPEVFEIEEWFIKEIRKYLGTWKQAHQFFVNLSNM